MQSRSPITSKYRKAATVKTHGSRKQERIDRCKRQQTRMCFAKITGVESEII